MAKNSIQFQLFSLEDPDKIIKIDTADFKCYSKKKMKSIYDDEDDYSIVGETKGNNKKREIGRILIGDNKKEFIVSKVGKNSPFFYGTAGYIKVGNDEYVQVLMFRWFFIVTFFVLSIAILSLITAVLINLLKPKGPTMLQPMPPKDESIVKIDTNEEGGSGKKVESESGGGSVSMIYTLSARLSLSTGEIGMYFKNPTDSNHDVVLQLCICSGGSEYKIAESGLISAGYGLYTMTYDAPLVDLFEGDYEALYRVLYYNPETGEKALVESVISDVVLTVSE